MWMVMLPFYGDVHGILVNKCIFMLFLRILLHKYREHIRVKFMILYCNTKLWQCYNINKSMYWLENSGVSPQRVHNNMPSILFSTFEVVLMSQLLCYKRVRMPWQVEMFRDCTNGHSPPWMCRKCLQLNAWNIFVSPPLCSCAIVLTCIFEVE